MSTNNLLASLYNVKRSNEPRSSSMFNKNLDILSFNNQIFANIHHDNLRSASFSKQIKNNLINNFAKQEHLKEEKDQKEIGNGFKNHRDIEKYTPLIKTVHKLGAKIKKQYFFFWCRMQALVNLKKSIDNKNNLIVQQKNKVNIQQQQANIKNTSSNAKDNERVLLNLLDNKQNNYLQTNMNWQKKQIELKFKENQEYLKNNISSIKCHKKQSSDQSVKKQPEKFIKRNQGQIIEQTLILKSKETIIEEFVSNLEAIENKYLCNLLKDVAFNQLIKKTYKVKSINKLLQFKSKQIKQIDNNHKGIFLKQLKNISNLSLKLDILENLITTLRQSKLKQSFTKIRDVMLLKLNEEIQNKQQINNQKKLQYKMQKVKKLQKKMQEVRKLQKKMQEVKKIQYKMQEVRKENLKIQKQVNHINQKTLSSSKPLNFIKIKCPNINQIKEDQIINFEQKQNNFQKERMKKLSHLYHQEPIFQIPDISDITLFNSVINHQMFNSVTLPNSGDLKIRNIQSIQQNFANQYKYSSIEIDKSPKFQKYESSTPSGKIKKNPSYTNIANIILTKRNSSRSNLNKIPTTKKSVDILCKKNSVEYLNKSTQKNHEMKNHSKGISALKQIKFDSNQYENGQNLKFQNLEHLQLKLKKVSKQKHCVTVRIPSEQFKKEPTNFGSERKEMHKNISISNLFSHGAKSASKKYVKSIIQSVSNGKINDIQKKDNFKHTNKENILTQSTTKRIQSRELKSQFCSQFDVMDPVAIKLLTKQNSSLFMTQSHKCFIQKTYNKKQQYEDRQPIFQHIQVNSQQNSIEDFENINNCISSQLGSEKKANHLQKSTHLRSKVDKIQMRTARKMKIEIENMINQRKKTWIGLVKF